MEAWIISDKDYWTQTHYYCKPCHYEHYGYPKRQNKWNNEPCLTCGKQLLDKGMWNNISGQERMCDTSCQYTILISNWMANTKVAGIMPSKILKIKNNPLEPVNIVLILNPDTFLDLKAGPEEFHEHYQNLVPTKEEQKQHLAQINT
ncbi:hypothetical protein G9A89_016545 [Geosiphon pyriformis]|nr:hypothetical protein G9A89_016545 [Geosiphon pyriformis]